MQKSHSIELTLVASRTRMYPNGYNMLNRPVLRAPAVHGVSWVDAKMVHGPIMVSVYRVGGGGIYSRLSYLRTPITYRPNMSNVVLKMCLEIRENTHGDTMDRKNWENVGNNLT